MHLRRILVTVLLCLGLITACSGKDNHLAPAIHFRSKLVQAGGCSFIGTITVDYGESIQSFRLSCDADERGELRFTILEPETLEGISATVSEDGSRLNYEGLSVDLGLLAEDSLAPAAAPAVILKSWLSGYILWAGENEDTFQMTCEQELDGVTVKVDSFFKNELPISAEICYNNYRILEMKIEEFQFH